MDSTPPFIKKILSQAGWFKTISVFLEIPKYVLGVQLIIKKNVKKIVFKGARNFLWREGWIPPPPLGLHVIIKR